MLLVGFAAVVSLSGPAGAVGPGDPPAPRIGPDLVRDAADGILSRPEFQEPSKSILQRIQDWLGRVFGRLFDALSGVAGSGPFGWIFVAALAGGILFAAFLIVRRVRRDPGREPDGLPIEGPSRPAADWRRDAEELERRGDWRGALRAHWRATVADLAERGLVEEVPGRTTGEYRQQVSVSVPDGAADFASATRLFEDAWYAAADVSPEDCTNAKELLGAVLSGRRSTALAGSRR